MNRIDQKIIRDKEAQPKTMGNKAYAYRNCSNPDEYIQFLLEKMYSLYNNYCLNKHIVDLVEIADIAYALAETQECSLDEFDKIKMQLIEDAGQFHNKTIQMARDVDFVPFANLDHFYETTTE